jgi:hypothetical protein
MKKLILSVFLSLVIASVGYAMVWHVSNQWNVRWDAVIEDMEGNPIAPENMEYSVVYAPTDKIDPIEAWRGPETQATITLDVQGQYLLGVIAHRMLDGEEVAKSEIAWSDDPESVGDAGVWGIMRFLGPKKVTGFGRD